MITLWRDSLVFLFHCRFYPC